jgi:hypothetical protein
VQRRRAGDDDEEADHPGQHRADDDVDALVSQVFHVQPLIDRVGLDEGKPPGRQGCADRRHRDQQGVAGQRDPGHDQPLGGRAPVGLGEQAGDDVGDEDRAERQQEVLDVAEVLPQHQGRDADRRQRHAEVATHPTQQVHRRRHPGEFGA